MQILSDQYSGSESKHARSGAVSLLAVYESNGAGAVLHDCLGSDDDEVEWSRVATHPCWSNSPFKRVFDFVFAFIAVVLFAPVMLMTALAVKLSSRGPILFKQTRVSKAGSQFTIYKFRSMRVERDAEGPCVTKAGDSRLTCIGGTLRRFKLDELPQLFNVLKGDMSIVGPRPKVPHHQTYELRFRPGITGAASLAFRNEEELLHRLPSEALDAYQVHVLMPLKATLDRRYMITATLFSDLKVIFDTVFHRGERVKGDELLRYQTSLLSASSVLHSRFTFGNQLAWHAVANDE